MEFDKNYFEAEVREGFYVTSDIKHAWAAQLEVLSDVDKACREWNTVFCRMGNASWRYKTSWIHTMG